MGNRLMSLKKRKKQKKEGTTYTVKWNEDLTEFPLGEGKTMLDYCPFRCGICLFGILKEDAKCGPCVSHVFHGECIDAWHSHQIACQKKYNCPVCMTDDFNQFIFCDEGVEKQ